MAELLVTLGPKIGLGAKAASTIGKIVTIAQPVAGVAAAVAGINAAKAQSEEHSRAAREARISRQIEAARHRRQARLSNARDAAAFAESGASSGTAQGVLTQNAVAHELDALMIEYQGEQEGRAADFRAQEARRGASPLRVFSAAIDGFSEVDPLNLAPYGGAGAPV